MSDINQLNQKVEKSNNFFKRVLENIREKLSIAMTGQVVRRVGDVVYEGRFDKQGNFLEGTVKYSGGMVIKGKFENINGHLVMREGTRRYGDGSRQEGKFDQFGRFIEGENHLKNGVIYRGKIDVNTGFVIDGEEILPNGDVRYVKR